MKNFLKKIFKYEEKEPTGFLFGDDIPLEWIPVKNKSVAEGRIVFISSVCILLFSLIIIRILSINIDFSFLHEKNTVNKNVSSFYRPYIVDRNGEILATNLQTFDLYVEPHNMVDPEISTRKLLTILPDLKYNDVIKKVKSKKKFIYLARKISPSERERIILIGEPGFQFIKNEGRVYPQLNLFSHVIGSVDVDNKAMSGIEKYIDDNKLVNQKNPITLSLDMYIQDAIRQNLLKAMENYGAKSAGGIVIDVKTGEILGMVSLPDFLNSDYKDVVLNPLYNNHTTLDVYEVGSVMKIFNTALAIENGYPNDKIFDVSKVFMVGSYRIKDSHPKKWLLNMAEGFIYSSNIVMANIAKDLGIEKQQEFLNKLNLLSKINIELPERGQPLLPKEWNEHANATIGYGYGLSPTMLHIVTAVNAIVNDGLFINPTILKRDENSLLKSYQVVSPETSDAMRKLMRLVVTNGTGYMANLHNILVGGKTGTSYKLVNGKYDTSKTRTFFLSIFPTDNPKYTMLIMLDEAKNNGCDTAACTTVPVSAKIIDDITPILNLDLKISKK